MLFLKHPTEGAKDKLPTVASMDDSLALEQHVGLPEQRNLWSQAPLAVGQVADVTSQLLLALPARLQLALQPPQLLIQPESYRERKRSLSSGFTFTCLISNCTELR